ncbi:hypothetical protein HXX76_011927 [Chlamydomonas incerta]|uniref:Uncharacterized protein n=1 Tax=Chlamydomonas incerta TaxID=51695 RepID=A0A835SWR4_CHLIN|nr:hypothetical protein HXX76_011927 [Chlamydomonas incerta]|eukprot:KAG2427940.1 hypothetical protein HXX76_011927 [Chlamydomonas incerta]
MGGAESDAGHVLVIADDNFQLRSMRHALFRAARDRGMGFLQVHVCCTLATALARNQQRTGLAAVPQDALCRMAQQFEPPQPERFAWEASSLAFSPSPPPGDGADSPRQEESGTYTDQPDDHLWPAEQVQALVRDLQRLWGPPPPQPPSPEELQRQREEGRAANAASYVHGLDVRTRKALSEAVAAGPEAVRAVVARGLNERRRALLQAARQLLAQAAAGAATAGSVLPAVGPGLAEEIGEGAALLERLRQLEEEFMADAGL